MATVVILGAGVGGIVTAVRLRSQLSREHRVVLVDKRTQFTFAPSYPWLMLGWRNASAITRDLSRLTRKGIEFLHAEVEGIDLERKRVRTSAQVLSYDYLVVALGAELAPQAIPGLVEHSHTMYDIDGAGRLQQALKQLEGGRVAVVVSSLPYKCPAAPYETALLLDYFFREQQHRRDIQVEVFTPEPLPMPVAGPIVGNQVKDILEQRGIAFHPGIRLSTVERGELVFEGGTRERFDLAVAIPPHVCPQVPQEAGLTEGSPWVRVDPHSLETRHEGVYALGDVTMIPLPNGMMLPKAGAFASGEAEVVAKNLAARIQGGEVRHEFHGDGT